MASKLESWSRLSNSKPYSHARIFGRTHGQTIAMTKCYLRRTVTPASAAETSAPTLGPLNCKMTPFEFCN